MHALAALAAISPLAAYGLAAPVHAIPAGQEELVLTMLGRGEKLPDGCELSGVKIDISVILASFACEAGPAMLKLEHPSASKQANAQTEMFALSPGDGSAAPALIDAIATNVRLHEAQFRWITPELASSDANDRSIVTSGLVGIIASLVLVASLWKRKRPKNSASLLPAAAEESESAGG